MKTPRERRHTRRRNPPQRLHVIYVFLFLCVVVFALAVFTPFRSSSIMFRNIDGSCSQCSNLHLTGTHTFPISLAASLVPAHFCLASRALPLLRCPHTYANHAHGAFPRSVCTDVYVAVCSRSKESALRVQKKQEASMPLSLCRRPLYICTKSGARLFAFRWRDVCTACTARSMARRKRRVPRLFAVSTFGT